MGAFKTVFMRIELRAQGLRPIAAPHRSAGCHSATSAAFSPIKGQNGAAMLNAEVTLCIWVLLLGLDPVEQCSRGRS